MRQISRSNKCVLFVVIIEPFNGPLAVTLKGHTGENRWTCRALCEAKCSRCLNQCLCRSVYRPVPLINADIMVECLGLREKF